MLINCDMGERGISHPEDLELMKYIDIANIACGGHCGDRESVDFFTAYAAEHDVRISAHLSFPDRINFGRKVMKMRKGDLMRSLSEQFALMHDVYMIKFHGALYNQSCIDNILAEELFKWMLSAGIIEIICPGDTYLADLCRKGGIEVIGEAFAERTYTYIREKQQLLLTDRSRENAVIKDVSRAVSQVRQIEKTHSVTAYIFDEGDFTGKSEFAINAQTICIHSDSPIALELARRLSAGE